LWVFDRPSGSPSSINIDAEFESGTYEGPFSVWKEGQCNVVRSTRNPVSSSPYKVEFTYQFIGSGSDCKVNRKYQIGFANIHFKSGKGLTKSFKINGVEQCGNGVVPTDVTKTTKVTETTIATEVTDATEATERQLRQPSQPKQPRQPKQLRQLRQLRQSRQLKIPVGVQPNTPTKR